MKAFFLFFILSISGYSQNNYPQDFISPLDIPLYLSGSFGELRSNHFHSGLDFRTNQKEGYNVFAIGEGYVSRIKISAFGYGKAIYITHPNGYTSVYGHLQKASPKIDSVIKTIHYKEKSFEIDTYFKPTDVLIAKGELIAFSGNSGGSGGPHLHFEIRDTKSEHIINPLLFGFDKFIVDTRKPVINELFVYPVDDEAVVNQSKIPIPISISLQKDGIYVASKVLAKGNIGFGLNAYDVSDKNYGKNGLYKIETMLDGKPNFSICFTSFSYDETRYINSFIDYSKYKKQHQRVQKLFAKNRYPLQLLNGFETNGVVDVKPNMGYVYKIDVSDYYGNKIEILVPIQYANQEIKIQDSKLKTKYFVKAKNEYNYVKDNVSVYIPENTFYEDFYLNFNVENGVLELHDDTVPIYNNIILSFEESSFPENQKDKVFIADVSGSKLYYNSTLRKENIYKARTKNFGKFKLVIDLIQPEIKPLNFEEGKWISNNASIDFLITDELSGIKTYEGYLNDEWILFDYNYKTKKITHYFLDKIVKEGKNDIKVIVVDNVGNSTIFESHFFRSQKK